jgi:hypothetical protein
MRIRLLASPPLFARINSQEYSIDVSTVAGCACVLGRLREDPERMICLATGENEAALRLAWREGLAVEDSPDAHNLARILIDEGLADDLTAPVRAGSKFA